MAKAQPIAQATALGGGYIRRDYKSRTCKLLSSGDIIIPRMYGTKYTNIPCSHCSRFHKYILRKNIMINYKCSVADCNFSSTVPVICPKHKINLVAQNKRSRSPSSASVHPNKIARQTACEICAIPNSEEENKLLAGIMVCKKCEDEYFDHKTLTFLVNSQKKLVFGSELAKYFCLSPACTAIFIARKPGFCEAHDGLNKFNPMPSQLSIKSQVYPSKVKMPKECTKGVKTVLQDICSTLFVVSIRHTGLEAFHDDLKLFDPTTISRHYRRIKDPADDRKGFVKRTAETQYKVLYGSTNTQGQSVVPRPVKKADNVPPLYTKKISASILPPYGGTSFLWDNHGENAAFRVGPLFYVPDTKVKTVYNTLAYTLMKHWILTEEEYQKHLIYIQLCKLFTGGKIQVFHDAWRNKLEAQEDLRFQHLFLNTITFEELQRRTQKPWHHGSKSDDETTEIMLGVNKKSTRGMFVNPWVNDHNWDENEYLTNNQNNFYYFVFNMFHLPLGETTLSNDKTAHSEVIELIFRNYKNFLKQSEAIADKCFVPCKNSYLHIILYRLHALLSMQEYHKINGVVLPIFMPRKVRVISPQIGYMHYGLPMFIIDLYYLLQMNERLGKVEAFEKILSELIRLVKLLDFDIIFTSCEQQLMPLEIDCYKLLQECKEKIELKGFDSKIKQIQRGILLTQEEFPTDVKASEEAAEMDVEIDVTKICLRHKCSRSVDTTIYCKNHMMPLDTPSRQKELAQQQQQQQQQQPVLQQSFLEHLQNLQRLYQESNKKK